MGTAWRKVSLATSTVAAALSVFMTTSLAQTKDDNSFKCLPSNFISDGTK